METRNKVGRPALKPEDKKKSISKMVTFQPDVIKMIQKHFPHDDSWSVVVNRVFREKYN